MATRYPELFKPFQIGRCKIKNRIAMAPMHLGGRMDSDGNMTDEVIDYYEARAKGGVGLIYSCGFNPPGPENGSIATSAFRNPHKFVAKVSKLMDKVHAYDTKMFIELGTGIGRVAFPGALDGTPVAPSAVPNRWDPNLMCRALTKEEIETIIRGLIEAAGYIKQTGADGICIGGAYGGYMTDQFYTAFTNQRDDEYGYGSNKIMEDVIRGIHQVCGDAFPIDVRISPRHYMKAPLTSALPGEEYKEYGRDIDETIKLAQALEKLGVNSLLIGNGCYDSFYWLYPPAYQEEGLWLADAKKIKDAVNIPVICAGKLNTPEIANKAIAEGFIDAAAIGRPSLADPDWANKARRGQPEEIRPCIGCEIGCIGRVFADGLVTCAVNPQCFYEKTDPVTPADVKKKVAVIGGGIGGMEAARVAAIRGHEVELYEKSDQLGGLFNQAAVPEFKREDHRLLAWYPLQLKKAGVKVHLNTEIKTEDLENLQADEIVFAIGAKPRVISLPGVKESVTTSDLLTGKVKPGERVVVVGGGQVGCEAALWLSNLGKKVTIVETLPALMSGRAQAPLPVSLMMLDMLKAANIETYTSASFRRYEDGAVIVSDASGEHKIPADTVAQSVGFVTDNALYQWASENLSVPVWNVGDSREPAHVLNSVRDGFFVGKNI